MSHHDSHIWQRDLDRGEFRLLRLFPEEPLRCEFIISVINDPPPYTAVSYAWGDLDYSCKVEVDGSSLAITSSLHGALNALRSSQQEPILVWADAVCIRQHHKLEQSQQVRMMARIYSQAESVAIWLGPELNNSCLALELLSIVSGHSPSSDGLVGLLESTEWQPHFRAVVDLFEREYWRRVWVVQEVSNARKIMVHCGDSALPWQTYASASEVFRRNRGNLVYHFPIISPNGTRSSLSRQRIAYVDVLCSKGPASLQIAGSARGSPQALLDIFRACRAKLASDPRDKIYGVLGAQKKDPEKQLISIDYSYSAKKVYVNTAKSILEATQKLDIVCDAIHYPLHRASFQLPSWVPDWSCSLDVDSIGSMLNSCAAGSTDAEFKVTGDQHERLEMSAVYLDTIERTGVALAAPCSCDEPLMAFLHWRAKLCQVFDPYQLGSRSQNAQEAFCRTLCFGQNSQSKWREPRQWMAMCCHVFGSLLRQRLPWLPLDSQLLEYADRDMSLSSGDCAKVLQDLCLRPMTGRRFFMTRSGLLGMGSGNLEVGDEVSVPLGSKTPVIVRQEGDGCDYRFVGDAYVDGYMNGKAIHDWKHRHLELKHYVLC